MKGIYGIIIFLALLICHETQAQPEGPNNSTNIFDGDGGQINDVWTNPNLARTQNDAYATLVTTTKNKRTNYLQVQKFGFNIPAGSSIDGIVVEIDRHVTAVGGGAADDRIRIIDASGNIDGGSDKSTGLSWPTSDTDAYQSYGGTTDTWNITDWTSAKINNNNFGVAIQGKTSNDNTTFNLFVDHVRITVYYTVGGSQRYAVATGNWDDTSSWATSAGGTPGASVPTASDDVFIGGGFTITQDVNGADCNSLTIGTSEGTPTGVLTFDNNNRDIDIGTGGLVITSDGDIISTFTPRLTSAGDFTLNTVLTNRVVEIRIDGADGLIIGGTGSLGDFNVQSYTTNTGTLTITDKLAGPDNRLINASGSFIIFSGATMNANIDLTAIGNTIEFAQTVVEGDFNIRKAGNSFYNLVISNNANKFYNGDITVNGDLTITSTGVLNNSSSDGITLFGNWINNNGTGGFIQGTGNGSEVIFSGTNDQSITNASGENFNRLEIDKSAGTVTANNAIVVEDRLLMTLGTFDMDVNGLTGTGDLDFDDGELILGATGVTTPQLTGTYTINDGTITFDGAGSQIIRSTVSAPPISSYVNVQFLGSGTKSLSGLTDINGNLTIGGTASLDATASNHEITLAGNWVNTSTFIPQNGRVTLNGSSPQTVTNASGETFNDLTINNSTASNAVVLGGPAAIDGILTLTDGHLVSTSGNLLTIGVSGTAVSSSDASHVAGPVAKIMNSTSIFTFPIGSGTIYQPASVTPTSTSTSTYQAQYFRVEQAEGAALGAGVDHISSQDYWSIDRTGGTADASVTLSWEYIADPEIDNIPELLVAQWDGAQWASQGNASTTGTANAGTITSNTISTFTDPIFVIASSTINNPLSINRYFVAVTGNWDDAGLWAYTPGGTPNAPTPTANKNVIIESGNTVTILDASAGQAAVSMLSLTVNGSVILSNTAARNVDITVGEGGLILGANADISGFPSLDDDNIIVGGDIVLNNTTNLTHTLLEVNFSSQANTISGTGSLPYLNVNDNNQLFIGDVTFTDLKVPNSATNNGTITIDNELSGGGDLINGSTGLIIWQGTILNNTVIDASTIGNTVQLTNNTGGVIDIRDAVSGNTFYNLILDGTDTFEQTANIDINGDLTIDAGAVLDNASNDRKLSIGGNWINNNGTGGFLTGTNDISFIGTAAQSIFTSSGAEVFENMIIDNTSSTGVTLLQGEVQVTNDLTLTDGNIYTDATNLLVIVDNATSDEGSADSFVDGPMKKIGNDAFVFPVGNGSVWARLAIESLSNFDVTTEFTCQYVNSSYVNTTSLDTDVNNVSNVEHWLLERIVDPGNDASCNVRLYWESATASSIEDLADLRVGHFYNSGGGDLWHNFGGTVTDNSNGTGEIVSNTLFTSFSPITFASENGFNPLPVDLVSFKAKVNDEDITLNWTTASEVNNDYFEVQRFTDLNSIEIIGRIDGNGTSTEVNNYELIDRHPIEGRAFYRLKQVDFNGEFNYSEIIQVEFIGNFKVVVYPNPGDGSTLSIYSGNYTGPIEISIFDQQGKIIKSVVQESGAIIHKIDFENKLPTGMYFVRLKYNFGVVSKRWIVE